MTGTSRREFLRCCAAALGGAALGGLNLVNEALAAGPGSFSEYRALVCVFLYGGNDSFNMLVPTSSSEYAQYLDARAALAVPQQDLLPITPTTPQTGSYGFNPACSELRDLFDQNRLAVLANVGPLIVPTTRADWQAKSVPLPPQLFSHSDQQEHWQTTLPGLNQKIGWAGRVAEQLSSVNGSSSISMNISIDGFNVLQRGTMGLPFNVGRNGIESLTGINTSNTRNSRRMDAFLELLNESLASTSNHLFEREFARVQQETRENAVLLSDALENQPALQTSFPADNRLAEQLEMVARLISIRDVVGAKRQIFFVGMGGWDTHGNQQGRHPGLLSQLSQGLSAFAEALTELSVSDAVTTFTNSDFGRTLTSNGDGTDHGWGGHSLVLGGCVAGGDIYGTMPTLEIGGPDDTRSGRLIPTTSVDQYAATLAKWYGCDSGQLASIFPNLANFSTPDLGFMTP